MSYADIEYHKLLKELIDLAATEGPSENRTDVKAYSLFGAQLRFNLAKGFPLLSTKKVHFKSIVTELLWFLKGDTNIKYLLEHNNHIWTDWRFKEFKEHCEATGQVPPEFMREFEKNLLDGYIGEEWGSIGKGYGHQWRNFGEIKHKNGFHLKEGFDQISWVINEIKTNPTSRRLIVSGWNPHEVDKVDLPPCHTLFQFHVEPMTLDERIAYTDSPSAGVMRMKATAGSGGIPHDTDKALNYFKVPTHKLSCQLYQRSADYFLGVPFNIASYALLTQLVANECNLGVGEFIWTGGNVHLYENHIEQAKQQHLNDFQKHQAPTVKITQGKPVLEVIHDDIELIGYESFPSIKATVAV